MCAHFPREQAGGEAGAAAGGGFGASGWQLQQEELDRFGSEMMHAAETYLMRTAITFGDESVDYLLQFAEKSEDNPFAQEAALQLLAKKHDSNTTQNPTEVGRYIFIDKSVETFDAAKAAHRLVQLADVSGGKPTVQQLAISIVGILANNHPSSKSALGTKLHRLLHFAESSQDRKVQQLALSAFEIIVHRHTENQSAAGGAAVHRLLQLAETSGDHPDVQAIACDCLASLVRNHEANRSAAGPTAVNCLLKLSHPSGDEVYVQKDALKALREVVVNHAGNMAAMTAAGDAAAHVRAVLSELWN